MPRGNERCWFSGLVGKALVKHTAVAAAIGGTPAFNKIFYSSKMLEYLGGWSTKKA